MTIEGIDYFPLYKQVKFDINKMAWDYDGLKIKATNGSGRIQINKSPAFAKKEVENPEDEDKS